MNSATNTSAASNVIRGLMAVFAILFVLAIAAAAYYYLHWVNMAKQAETVSSSFVKSSPVVERDLGTIVRMKEISAGRAHGRANQWIVEYHVSGQKGTGSVQVVVQNAEGNWNVPGASLMEAGRKPINLL
jgi:Cytochrome oxidase complex assembly protein 1